MAGNAHDGGRMVAPTGVNTEIHHEQVNPETAPAEPAEAGAEEAAQPEADLPEAARSEAAQPEAAQPEADLQDGVIWEAGAGLDQEPTEAERAETELVEAELAQTELAEADLAEVELAEVELAEVELAETEWAGERESRDVRPWAVAAIFLGVIVLVGVAAGALAVVTHGFHKKTLVTYRPAAVFRLRPGDCINSAPNGLVVTVLACGTPHQAEVFATFSLPKSSWPGNTAVEQDAGNGCASRLGGYLNPDLANAGLAQEFVYPNQAAWQAGERTVVCEVSSSTGNLTGSVRKPS
jgi:hypothetical protein